MAEGTERRAPQGPPLPGQKARGGGATLGCLPPPSLPPALIFLDSAQQGRCSEKEWGEKGDGERVEADGREGERE